MAMEKRIAVIAIDPGNMESGVCVVDADSYKPMFASKLENAVVPAVMFEHSDKLREDGIEVRVAIEMVASYGMPVGKEVFDTCVWIGRFIENAKLMDLDYELVYRKDEKLAICHSPNANDATIRQALVDRFAYGVPNYGKGSKKEPGWFYGFKADIWSSYAVAVTAIDRMRKVYT